MEKDKDLEFEPEIDGDSDCVFETCEKCGRTYGESQFDEHDCEPEDTDDLIDIDEEWEPDGYDQNDE